MSSKTVDNFIIIQRYERDESIKTGKSPYFSGGKPVASFRARDTLYSISNKMPALVLGIAKLIY